jgi:4-hydroxy-tetrahydrodipicolinate reductase
MKIALIGYGKMGKTIERLAKKAGHEIVLTVDIENEKQVGLAELSRADVAIEFTGPESAYSNIIKCFNANVPVVCGSTGWLDRFDEIERRCKDEGKALFYSPNYSIGVNLFFEINKLLAKLMNSHPEYDEILIHETHHTGKLDSPSGTAISLANQVINEISRLKQWANYKSGESLNPGTATKIELPIFSSREEDVPGTHIVKYFSASDEIEIIHKASNREGFAHGAVAAAEWIVGKKGVFGMKDLLKL